MGPLSGRTNTGTVSKATLGWRGKVVSRSRGEGGDSGKGGGGTGVGGGLLRDRMQRIWDSLSTLTPP